MQSTQPSWKSLRQSNQNEHTVMMEKLAAKVQYEQMEKQRQEQQYKEQRAAQLGLRSATRVPNWYVADHAKDVMKYQSIKI